MKRFSFLLLDAGPVIKLFELGIWDSFIEKCDVTISRIVADQCVFSDGKDDKQYIDFGLKSYEEQIRIIDVDLSTVKAFYDKFDLSYQDDIHAGEKETLAFLENSSEDWQLCAADGAVFRVLGFIGRAEQGISLEEILVKIGLSQKLEWRYTKRFREKYTQMGQFDSIQNKDFP